MKLEAGMQLPSYEVIAKNYGAEHANKIHSDAGAAEHGFAAALVPGVAMYAYLTQPVVDALGREWLQRGEVSAKFVQPIYDGEHARAEARMTNIDPLVIDLQLFNSAGQLCAVGNATMPVETQNFVSLPNPQNYPSRALPPEDACWPATIAAINVGDAFGSLDFTLDLTDRMAQFLEDMVAGSPLYRGANAVCHPAFWIVQANEIFMRNIALGMWIHTASEVQHLALAEDGEQLSLRGRVVDAVERRGHELITADLALFGKADRVIAHIKHTAIIRLKA
ncbi:MAG: hotdog fold thioesterase [Acidobacteriota bacterium]|nr:hotdog fold thioesterase [Acidobacteriota bacterium]